MEMLVGMEDEQVDTTRSRAGSCVEFHSIKVSFPFAFKLSGIDSISRKLWIMMTLRK